MVDEFIEESLAVLASTEVYVRAEEKIWKEAQRIVLEWARRLNLTRERIVFDDYIRLVNSLRKGPTLYKPQKGYIQQGVETVMQFVNDVYSEFSQQDFANDRVINDTVSLCVYAQKMRRVYAR
jgi:hypothetical protein